MGGVGPVRLRISQRSVATVAGLALVMAVASLVLAGLFLPQLVNCVERLERLLDEMGGPQNA